MTAADPMLLEGATVGEYVIEGVLGQGAFGTVFKAVHPLIGKVVAVKVLSRKFSADPEMVDRFVAEARAVNQIRHRHIIDIFSFGQLEDGRSYYVMEHVDGEPLDAMLEREGALPLGIAVPLLRSVGRALDAAHGKGIAHRDLKPENVFLARDEDGVLFPKLLDFGIAKLLGPEDGGDGVKSKTRTGVPLGTPYFMSPEQCRGKGVDHRTDYYAFGVMAYLMLTGTYPIDGDDYMTLMMNQMSQDPPPASSRKPGLPAGVDDALAWLMQKDPAARPPSLAAAVRALEGAAAEAGIPVPGAPTTMDPIPRVMPPVRATPVPTRSAEAVAPTLTPADLGGRLVTASITGRGAPTMSTAPAPVPAPRSAKVGFAIAAGVAVLAAVIAVLSLTRGGGEAPAEPVAAKKRVPERNDRPERRTPPKSATVTPPRPAPPAPPRPAEPEQVTFTIKGLVKGTLVLVDKEAAGRATDDTYELLVPRGKKTVQIDLKRPGYQPVVRVLAPTQDRELEVTQVRIPSRPDGVSSDLEVPADFRDPAPKRREGK